VKYSQGPGIYIISIVKIRPKTKKMAGLYDRRIPEYYFFQVWLFLIEFDLIRRFILVRQGGRFCRPCPNTSGDSSLVLLLCGQYLNNILYRIVNTFIYNIPRRMCAHDRRELCSLFP